MQMSNSEDKFRQYLLREYPVGYILKVPDFKQTGNKSTSGLPDYMVIQSGNTYWYEVKYVKSSIIFALNNIRDSQWITFRKMMSCGAKIYLAVYFKNKLKIYDFYDIYKFKFNDGKSKIYIDDEVN
jgi:penicillin-binding protein-related factor A (putative recombinase)